MIFDWTEVLPTALKDLKPVHQEIIGYIANLQGKRRPTYTHAKKTWNLDRDEFTSELNSALLALRNALQRRVIHRLDDLDMR